jgi:hypothetical protein
LKSMLQSLPENAPLYVRWSAGQSPYAIELKLELVAKICQELAQAEKPGIEIGGVLIGSFPSTHTPTLRIENFEIIPRRPEDGAVYMLDPDQQERFANVRWTAKGLGQTVGFFRTHTRPGPLKPSLADRGLLAGQFHQATYVVLLIQAREPHTAAFFIASNAQLPDEPSVKEFRFDEKSFKALPEIQEDATASERAGRPRNAARFAFAGIPLLILLIGATVFWLRFNAVRTAANPLGLAVTASDHLLKVSWNHAARQIMAASDATLVISDGATRREIKLGPDELKRGSVDYQPNTQQVEMTMTLNTPGSSSASQSIDWSGK